MKSGIFNKETEQIIMPDQEQALQINTIKVEMERIM